LRYQIAIIGLGLMGGSIGLELAQWEQKGVIRGYDIKEEVLDIAQDKGAIDYKSLSVQEAVEGSDLVFIATPVRSIPQVFSSIRSFLAPSALVCDLGSTKQWVYQQISPDIEGIKYIGFHPMSGGEMEGIRGASLGLFHGFPLFVSPFTPLEAEDLSIVENIAQLIGGRVFF